MDPHTAVAADAVQKLNNEIINKTIMLATAHPAKFPNALESSGISLDKIPYSLKKVLSKKEKAYERQKA